MGVVTISTHHYLPDMISFPIGKTEPDEVLASKYLPVAVS